MLTGSELTTAIAAVLIGAVCAGFLLHGLWSHLNRSRTSANARLDEMAARLHDADMAREAELTRELAAVRLELETMRGGLGNARRRMIGLEAEIEPLRAAAG